MNLTLIKQNAGSIVSRAKFVLNKRSPEICLVGGIVLIVGGTIWACKSSRKLDALMDEHESDRELIEEGWEESQKVREECDKDGETPDVRTVMTVANYRKEKAKCYLITAGELARMYTPAVVMMTCGIGLIVNGHRILTKRNAALMAAYTTLEDAFGRYRTRVKERYGEEIENEIYTGKTYVTMTGTTIDEDGKKKKTKEQVPVITTSVSPYARFYNAETSTEWHKSQSFNHTFLVCQQNAANDLLRSRALKNKRGWVFLNEVYEMLGIKPDPTGAICGWLTPAEGEEPTGDNYIDFGIVEGSEEDDILLDFNCQGIIYDQI